MKFCIKHWEQLKFTVKEKGMWHLVHKSSEELIDDIKNELDNKEHQFDPLHTAHIMIITAVLQQGGIYMLMNDENNNERCPLCEIEKQAGEELVKNWIDGSTNECLNYCKEMNLLNQN